MVRSFSAPAPVTTTPKITSMSERAFSASYDSTTRAISAAVCLLLMVVAWVVHMVFIALLFPLLIGLAYAYSPRGYAISGGAIVVQRLIGKGTAGGDSRDAGGDPGRFHGLSEAV